MKAVLKRFYKTLPFKKQFFTLLRAVWKPAPRLYRHLYFSGNFTVRIDAAHSFRMRHYGFQLENEIFWEGLNGGWEKVSMGLWTKLCRDAEVIFDVGANTGVFALIAKSVNREANVYAFEPVQRVFEKLAANNRLNGYDIRCVPAAVSDTDGAAVIYDAGGEHVYSVAVNRNLYGPGVTIPPTTIDVLTLDGFIAAEGLPKVDLLKLDVEGHEPEALRGFARYLRAHRPTLLIEILGEGVAAQVEAELAGLGYLYFNIDERKGVRRVERLGKSDSFNFLVCGEVVAGRLGL